MLLLSPFEEALAGSVVASVVATCVLIYFYRRKRRYVTSQLDISQGLSHPELPIVATPKSCGNTPLLYLSRLSKRLGCHVYGKCEYMNPSGSVKDRAVQYTISSWCDEMRQGRKIRAVVEGTSGSTGISLAQLSHQLGNDVKCRLYVPDDISEEKVVLMRSLGAEVVKQPNVSIANPRNITRRAQAIAQCDPEIRCLNQFDSLANFAAHYEFTAPEIVAQLSDTPIDVFVASAGTGGTIAGIAAHLKETHPSVRVLLADPTGSALSGKVNQKVLFEERDREGMRRRVIADTVAEGIGLNRLTRNFAIAAELIDEAFRVSDDEARAMAQFLLEEEGLFLGSSSAINCAAVCNARAAGRIGGEEVVVTILCDRGERYLSRFYA